MGPHTTIIVQKLLQWGRLSTLAVTLGTFSLATTLLAEETSTSAKLDLDGSYVLLSNGSVAAGKSTRLGQYITVARESSQIRLTAQQVAHIGNSLDDLYQFRIVNRIPGDLRQLKHDIRWSLHNGLVQQAAEDVLEARKLSAADPEVVHLLRMIAAEMRPKSPTPPRPSPVQQVAYHEKTEADSDPGPQLPDNLSERSFHEFITKVQPILMNRCAGCHSSSPENETGLSLRSSMEATWAPKRTAARNLDSVMKFIDPQALANSQLRLRATDNHGGMRKSFGKPGSPMMRRLDTWLTGLTNVDASPQSGSHPSKPRPVQTPPRLSELASPDTTPETTASEMPSKPDPEQENAPTDSTAAAEPESSLRRMPKVNNPFDPDLFNRHFHR